MTGDEAAQRYIEGFGAEETETTASSHEQPRRKKSKAWKYILVLFAVFAVVIIMDPFGLNIVISDRNNAYATEAAGFSMEPTVHCGDIVVVQTKDAPGFSLAAGDILVFLYPLDLSIESLSDITSDSQYIIVGHKILSFDGDKILCRGDNNNATDPLVSEWQIVGKIIDVTPRMNYLKRVMVYLIVGGNRYVLP